MASNVRDRPDEFRRILAKRTIRGKKISSTTPFLHFESKGDMFYCEKFIRFWKKMNEFSEVPLRKVQFVFTSKKSEAIMSHQEALAEGVNVSTLVDMDYDIDGFALSKIEHIHSTKPACTLATLQFVQSDNELNKNHLINVIKDNGPFDDEACERVISRTYEGTYRRLEMGIFRNKKDSSENPHKTIRRMKKALPYPINDHELARSIAVEQGHSKYENPETKNDQTIYDIENRMKEQALNDPGQKLRKLLLAMYEDVKSAYIDTTKQ